jgi:hypothetical protein
LDLLFRNPYVTARFVENRLGVSYGTANGLIRRFVDAGILEETTNRRRNRWFAYRSYVGLFGEGTSPPTRHQATREQLDQSPRP